MQQITEIKHGKKKAVKQAVLYCNHMKETELKWFSVALHF